MTNLFPVLLAAALLFVTPARAATFVSVFNFSWSGTPGSGGPWGITASSEFINPYPDDSVLFDPINGTYRVEGRVDIVGGPGESFDRQDVIALNLDVITNGYRIASYSIAKEDLRVGIMSGSIVEQEVGGYIAQLTAFRLMQTVDPNNPDLKFEQIFGCPTIQEGCGSAAYVPPFSEYGSGNPVPPSGPNDYYGVVVLTDGRSDPCCGARANALRFYYETPDAALASFRMTWDRDKSYYLDDPVPEGLPNPVPVPGTLPLLLAAVGALGFASRRGRASVAPR